MCKVVYLYITLLFVGNQFTKASLQCLSHKVTFQKKLVTDWLKLRSQTRVIGNDTNQINRKRRVHVLWPHEAILGGHHVQTMIRCPSFNLYRVAQKQF